ncbi:MAG TPA: DUF459 domain-containing protein [Candidatus Pacearchaeota archaeon]|nr:DUF459 domain-containing protein [Candidatus Parcubacteria bacterium]HNP79264.1 DUF459 domain-containing protein [Candidatus Pacearchaeota archaeon]HOC53519.1 DUF459 domain-containing protein [Candidatus Pacearchaeota archaeon]HQM24407.1 DUF459 domain-containing protein [Candidatus Pacearchaeota archaeon]
MEIINIKNETPPIVAIFVFIMIIIILPFCESKRFSLLQKQEPNQNIFTETILKYSLFSESIKSKTGLNEYFEKEQEFWVKIKESPLASKGKTEEIPIVIEENIKTIPEEKEETTIPSGEKEEPKEETVQEEYLPIVQPIINAINESLEEGLNNNDHIVKKEPPFKILIMGDSFMAIGGGLGDPLERTLLGYKDVSVNRYGRVSSGLTNQNYLNWNTTAINLINQYTPNVAIVIFGANDDKGIVSSETGKTIWYGSPGWNEEYAKRVNSFIDILEKNNITLFWVGLPIMKDKTFSEKMNNLNSIYEAEVSKRSNAYYIPTWDILADENGNYATYMKDSTGKSKLIRTSDGVHLQYYAGYLISDVIILEMQKIMILEKE